MKFIKSFWGLLSCFCFSMVFFSHLINVLAQPEALSPINLENASQIVVLSRVGENRADDIAWSPDGRTIAAVGPDGIQLYDAQNLESPPYVLAQETQYECTIWTNYRRSTVQFSSDGQTIIVGSGGCLEFWDVQAKVMLARYFSDAGTGNLDYNDAQNMIVYGNGFPNSFAVVLYDVMLDEPQNEAKYIFDPSNGFTFQTIGFGPVSDASITPDGSLIALSSAWFEPFSYPVDEPRSSNDIFLWETQKPVDLHSQILELDQVSCVLQGHKDQVGRIEFSSSGNLLASASHDRTVRLWDISACEENMALKGHLAPVWDVAFHPDDVQVASAGWDAFIRIWDVSSGRELHAISVPRTTPIAISYSPDGSKIAALGWDNSVFIFDVVTGDLIASHVRNWGMYWGLAFSPDGSRLTAGSSSNLIVNWRVTDTYPYLQEAHVIQGHEGVVYDVDYSPDGRFLVSGSGDQTVRVWDLETNQALATLTGHTSSVYSVVYSPDGRYIASGSWDATVRLWNAETFELMAVLESIEPVYSVAFSPDSRLLAYGDTHIWDIEAGQEFLYIETRQWWSDRFRSDIGKLTFTPDGTKLINGANTEQFYLIDVRSRTLDELAARPNGRIPAVSPDGELIALGSLQLYNFENSAPLYSSEYNPGDQIFNTVHDVIFSTDSRMIVTSDATGAVQIWGIPTSP